VLEWFWFTRARGFLSRILGLLLGCMSILIVLGEVTLFVSSPIGVVPLLFEEEHGAVSTQVLCLVPLLYILYSTYIALFRLRLKGKYGMYSHNNTDAANLVWCSLIMARLTPPLVYNFLLLIKVDNTRFSKVMGVIDIVPILGQDFAVFFPLILVLFCLVHIFNLQGKLMNCLGFPQFVFSENYNDERVSEGRDLIQKERSGTERSAVSQAYSVHEPARNPVQEHSFNPSTQSRYQRIRQAYSQYKKPLLP